MGSATSSISPEPFFAAAAVAGVLGYGYVNFVRPAAHSDDVDAYSDASAGASKATSSTLRGQKKRGRKLQLPGDATLKNLDVLDAPVPGSLSVSTSASKTRERQRQLPSQQGQQQHREAPAVHAPSRDVVPGGFDGAVSAVDDARDAQQEPSQPPVEPQQVQQQQQQATKKPKKKKGKKTAVPPSESSSAPAVGAPPSLAGTPASSAAAAPDGHDERWTRVEARKKKAAVPARDGLAELQSGEATPADVTTSDAGVTTSVTGNSSPVTERTTEDGSEPEPDESVMDVSATSFQGARSSIVPVRPPPGEKPAKGFTWQDYEGVQVDEDASDEDDGGWGVVRSRRKTNKAALEGGEGATGTATTTAGSQSQSQTKKQRQNAQRREALKEVKREREAQQQAALATHKRELAHARVAEPVAAVPKRTGSRFDSLG